MTQVEPQESMTVKARTAAGPTGMPKPRLRVGRRTPAEWVIEGLLFLAAASSVVITFTIVGVLLYESWTFFQHVSLVEFLTDTQWTPLFSDARYGILPLVGGTLVTTIVALLVAIPVGTITAIYLSEYAPHRVREVVKPVLELLSAVPTVVYGYFALLFVTPMLQQIMPNLPGFNMLSPGLVIGVMIIPYVSSLSEDAMHAVPMYIREGSYAMGATRMQTAFKVIMPSAFSGVTAAYILGISRALGETMVVAVAGGLQPNLTIDPTQPASTITAYIVQVSLGDLPHASIGYQSIFAAGLTLMIMTLAFNIAGFWLRRRYREVYSPMPQVPHDSRTPTPSADPELLRSQIKRRKLADLAFATLGVALVALSLSVLVVLFGQLVRDGTKRLVSNHEVTPSGYAPGRFELVGTLRKKDDGGKTEWFLHRDAHGLVFPAAPPADELKPLDGKPVIVDGDPSSEQRTIEVSSVKAAPSPTPGKHARDLVHGTLVSKGGAWRIEPTPIPLDTSNVEGDFAVLAGERVAVDPGRSKTVPLALRSVEKLVSQGFFNSMPSRDADRAGIKSAIVGSILVIAVTMLLAVPLGVAAGLYLEEYGRKNWLTALIEINIANLAGVPSIIWGLMALGLFVYQFGFGRSILTAGLTLGLLVLPIVIMATREAVRAIPLAIREASYACGASKWQTVRYHIIPYSMSGILTGGIIGLSRAIGETAPLITIGALMYVAHLPDFSWSAPLGWLKSDFTVLPIQMFNWISRPDKAFHENAAAAGMVLLVLTLSMNAVAIVLRYRLRKRIKW